MLTNIFEQKGHNFFWPVFTQLRFFAAGDEHVKIGETLLLVGLSYPGL